MNFFPKIHEFWFDDIGAIVGSLGNNPHTKVWNEEEFYDAGYRTPHLYYQARNFTPETNPWGGDAKLRNLLLFMGEHGEQRYDHGDIIATVTGDGMEIFSDSLCLLYKAFELDASRSLYQIEVVNDKVFAYGKNMINHTIIDFDMDKPDVNPPALTMLRIIDQEKISMFVAQANTARLEITAGDFSYDANIYSIIYDKKPSIAVSWSTDGKTFYELPTVEDASKFHPGYGNFFNVSLAPLLELGGTTAWIIIKIVLTDEAGNRQEQILDPLFQYLGHFGIEEILFGQQSNVAYPNPFTGNVNIELKNPVSGEVYLEIYDISGRIIRQQKVNCNKTTSFLWNGSHLKEGMYFYGIYSKEGVVRGKIIKQ